MFTLVQSKKWGYFKGVRRASWRETPEVSKFLFFFTWWHEIVYSSVSTADVLQKRAPRLRKVAQVTTLRIFAEPFPVFVRQLKEHEHASIKSQPICLLWLYIGTNNSIYKHHLSLVSSVTRKILPVAQNDFTRKMIDFNTFTKLPKNEGDLSKLVVTKGFKKLPKVQ